MFEQFHEGHPCNCMIYLFIPQKWSCQVTFQECGYIHEGSFPFVPLRLFFFIFLDEPDGALRGFIFSSFLFWVILHDCWSLLNQSVHFASLPLVPLSQRSWFLIWILGIFVGYVFFIIWKRTVSYKKVATYLPIFNKYSNYLNCT